MQFGRIKFYNRSKNFGFVIGDDGQEYYFNSACLALPQEQDRVVFEPEASQRGNMAKGITIQKSQRRRGRCVIFAVVGLIIGFIVGFLAFHA